MPLSIGRERQANIYLRGLSGKKPGIPTHPGLLEQRAEKCMSRAAWAYVQGGAGSEITQQANREAFTRVKLIPRVMHPVDVRDLSVDLLGKHYSYPLLMAPLGALDLIHPQADLTLAQAAKQTNIGMIFSNQSAVPMESCAQAMGDTPHWFQLYWSSNDQVVSSLLHRAEACGCEAIVLTVDTTLLGWRPRDLNLGHLPFLRGYGLAQYLSDPAFRKSLNDNSAHLSGVTKNWKTLLLAARLIRKGRTYQLSLADMRRAIAQFIATYSRPDLQWNDISRLRSATRLPIWIKGIRRGEDARKAEQLGIDGIIVSNHGGRQVDGERAALDDLMEVVQAVNRLPILFDSGIRSGADVAKALAVGASACLIGRPIAYALAVGGLKGVCELIQNIVAELDLTLALCGCRNVQELRQLGYVYTPPSSY
ncbi:MAG: alpha-hydroxy-acid oxidizing protein [Thermoflavifilum sp.]|nr:alpha-hydroxy-acid oxidizing protein [Thermoflavifilum sp.]